MHVHPRSRWQKNTINPSPAIFYIGLSRARQAHTMPGLSIINCAPGIAKGWDTIFPHPKKVGWPHQSADHPSMIKPRVRHRLSMHIIGRCQKILKGKIISGCCYKRHGLPKAQLTMLGLPCKFNGKGIPSRGWIWNFSERMGMVSVYWDLIVNMYGIAFSLK